jgi:serine protease Do
MSSIKPRFVWPIVAALALAGGTYFGAFSGTSLQAQTAKPTQEPEVTTVAPAVDLSKAFRAVHESLKDAVVNINISKQAVASDDQRLDIPEQFRGMLPPGFQDQLQNQLKSQRIEGTGSGVIISADGYILTNNHVVDSADNINVTLNDGREFKGERVGTDPKTDLAVIRIKADHLTYAKFGDSDKLEAGDWVLAFGSPFGFSQTMTQGIISAKGRHVPIIAEHDPNLKGMTYENFLQTDAAINPGNSGGPLVNLKGEVIGINAAIASDTGAYNGIGFSIPSNDAQYVMHSLIEHGKVVRGYLGVGISDIAHPATENKGLIDNIRKSGYTAATGVLVGQLSPGGPGALSGLQVGDVITSMNGQKVTDVDSLRNQIARTTPDSKINLDVFRDGKNTQLSVTVGAQPDSLRPVALANSSGRDRAKPVAGTDALGVHVEDLDASTARRTGLSKGQGAVIESVDPDSLAAESGLKPGDVITKVEKTTITSAQQFADSMKGAKLGDGVKLVVRSDDGMDHLVYLQKN